MSSDEDDSGGGGKCFFGTALPELKDDDPANLRKKPLAIEEQVWSSTQFDPFSLYGQSNNYSFAWRADSRVSDFNSRVSELRLRRQGPFFWRRRLCLNPLTAFSTDEIFPMRLLF